jgi:hypothetical protein
MRTEENTIWGKRVQKYRYMTNYRFTSGHFNGIHSDVSHRSYKYALFHPTQHLSISFILTQRISINVDQNMLHSNKINKNVCNKITTHTQFKKHTIPKDSGGQGSQISR